MAVSSYDEYQRRAQQQVDPTYNQAKENVRQQTYTNRLQAGNTAASRGLSHSGLAADLQNKVNIAGQRDIAGLDAQRASRIGELAQQMMYRDQDDNRWQQEFDYRKGRDTVGDARWQSEYDYRQHRDTVGDTRYSDQFNWEKALEEWRRQYLGQRDAVTDQQYKDQLDLQRRQAQYNATLQWKPYTF